MVVTSRGGVGCCWVNSLVSLTDYSAFLFCAASVSRGGHLEQFHVHEISQATTHVNSEIIRFKGALFSRQDAILSISSRSTRWCAGLRKKFR